MSSLEFLVLEVNGVESQGRLVDLFLSDVHQELHSVRLYHFLNYGLLGGSEAARQSTNVKGDFNGHSGPVLTAKHVGVNG